MVIFLKRHMASSYPAWLGLWPRPQSLSIKTSTLRPCRGCPDLGFAAQRAWGNWGGGGSVFVPGVELWGLATLRR